MSASCVVSFLIERMRPQQRVHKDGNKSEMIRSTYTI